ncbi:hypothetical protein [Cellulomonas bogoriensis]|uniref:Lipoprotein n=1 Tax=Cellulomonas bogoriensis 69B4 = DSM 16987 TaxID=1386082 RepID=A0A0A0BVG0_9CELL|nr:hypothetical protein [Cellulomonas bogoriensis]KGM11911.1 hypothetical protein N869_02330 [Cellulomonas bogoriensis 69B4 = DSM 16987]
MNRARALALPLALGTVLALTACAADPEATDPTEPPTDAETGDTEAQAPAGGDVDPACLQGSWDTDLERLLEVQTAGVEVDDYEHEFSGSAVLTYDDGTMIREADELEVTQWFSVEGQQMESWMREHGTVTGTYTLDGDRLEISDLDSSDIEVQTRTEIEGEEVPAPEIDPADVFVDGMYFAECAGDELYLTPDLSELEAQGIEVDPADFRLVYHRR